MSGSKRVFFRGLRGLRTFRVASALSALGSRLKLRGILPGFLVAIGVVGVGFGFGRSVRTAHAAQTVDDDRIVARYVAKVAAGSWEPIPTGAIQSMLEERTMPALRKVGGIQFRQASYSELDAGDFILTMDARFVEEAEKLAIYLTFKPSKNAALPSYHVLETTDLGGLKKSSMQQRIEKAVEQAAERLVPLVGRAVRTQLRQQVSPIEDEPLPSTWGQVDVPDVASPSALLKQLLDVREEDHVRAKAASTIADHAFDEMAARHALQICVLRDPTPAIRIACVRALTPVARADVPTQRILLHAMRTEVDEQVLSALIDVSEKFVGLSRKESIDTWLDLVSEESTPPNAAQAVARLLAAEDTVPNLDLAVARCLCLESLVYGKRQACSSSLLRKVPDASRLAVVWRYLQTVSVFERGEQNVLSDVLEALVGRGRETLSPEAASLLMSVALRPSAGWARREVLTQLGRTPDPDATFIARLGGLLRAPDTSIATVRVIEDVVRARGDLRATSLAALKAAHEDTHFLTSPTRQDPMETIERAIERLSTSR